MDKKLLIATSIAGLAFIAGGCEEFISDLEMNFSDGWLGNEESTIDVREASVIGQLGPVGQMESRSASFDPGYDSGDYTSFNITGASDEGEIMQIVQIDGGIYHPLLQTAGSTLSNDCDDSRDSFNDDAPPMMRVVGCSDTDGGAWDYDRPCEDATIEVEEHPEDPGVLMYTVTSTFQDDDSSEIHEVTSRFAIPRQDGVAVPESEVDTAARDEWVLGQIDAGSQSGR